MKINGKLCYFWRAVDHEGEVLETVVTAKRDKGRCAQASEADHEEIRGSSQHRHRWASGIFGGNKGYRRCSRPARGRRSAQQSRREFASAVSATRTRDAAFSKYEDAAEVQLSSRPGPQPFHSGAASGHPADIQAETLGRIGGVARPCSVDPLLREAVSRYASTNRCYLTTPDRLFRPISSSATQTAHMKRSGAELKWIESE